MKFTTHATIEDNSYNRRILLLDKNNVSVDVTGSDADVHLQQSSNNTAFNVKLSGNQVVYPINWEFYVQEAKSAKMTLGLRVPDQTLEGNIELDLDCLDDNMLLKDKGEGYTCFPVEINLKDVEVDYENVMGNPFVDDFSLELIELEISQIKQISEERFAITITKATAKF